LSNTIEECLATYDNKLESEVRPAFQKFDADGSGAIDKQELQKLSELLGHKIAEGDELDNALKSLDLNGDGVIDFEEFSRWYFSGMRPYNDTKHTMLLFGKGGLSIL